MRAIDVDMLKKDLNMADNCDECPLNGKECEYGSIYSKKDFCQWLDDAPTIESTPHWIPCSKRVPEEDEQVLVYLYDSPYIAWIDSNGEWNTEDFTLDKEKDREDEPIAWMPLPEPYKGGGADMRGKKNG